MTNANETKGKKKRIFYFDALRALAIICVIIIHIYAFTKANVISEYAAIPSIKWLFTQFLGIPFRIGVDLFLMLSGALSLGRVWDIKTFLGKRLPRIVSPFIFWNVVLVSLFFIISYFTSMKIVNSFDIMSILTYFYGAITANALGFRPNWFFWMILGTYLIMPIFNKWLLHSELTEAEYFLFFWLITGIFDYTLFTEFPIKLSYFTSPIGLVVLGYYLRYTERKIFKNKIFVWALILIPLILSMVISTLLSSPTRMYMFNRYSILMCLEVAGVFLLFRNTDFKINEDGLVYKFIFSLAKYSYGIYLLHYPILLILVRLLRPMPQIQFCILLFVLLVPIVLIIMSLLNRVPYVNRVIGAK